MNTVYSLSVAEPIINKREIMRYMSSFGGGEEIYALVDECLDEVLNVLEYKVCYTVMPIEIDRNKICMSCGNIESRNLVFNLNGCEKTIIFAATIGVGIDRLIAKYSRISPSKALCFQAIGAERVEALCDDFCGQMAKKIDAEHGKLKPRFSPGYGDLPLETQKMIFSLLDCPKRIGVTLGDSLLMSPSKSVTAFIGITE